MMRGKGLHPVPAASACCAALGVVWKTCRPHQSQSDLLLTGAVLVTPGPGPAAPGAKGRIEGMAVTLFGVLYVGWLSAHLVLLRELPWRRGQPYADGRRVRAARVLPDLELRHGRVRGRAASSGARAPGRGSRPRKSVEGSVGGLVAAVVAAFVARAWFAPFLTPAGRRGAGRRRRRVRAGRATWSSRCSSGTRGTGLLGHHPRATAACSTASTRSTSPRRSSSTT